MYDASEFCILLCELGLELSIFQGSQGVIQVLGQIRIAAKFTVIEHLL